MGVIRLCPSSFGENQIAEGDMFSSSTLGGVIPLQQVNSVLLSDMFLFCLVWGFVEAVDQAALVLSSLSL